MRNNDPQSCYVKNLLQPTRSFGDFRLKHEDLATSSGITSGNSSPSKAFTGPYITHKPDIKVLEVDGGSDRYLVMGSDGLWDEVTKDDVARVVATHPNDKNQIAATLFHLVLLRTAEKYCISVADLA